MKLSIGMIVKNEEKFLDQCLNALIPILKNVDSELIIVDTGSTDSTVEIAKKYTNKVLYFEWCKDFAKARNESLKNASGEWFLYIDADEILVDANEIINFFNTDEYKKYSSACYEVVNYRNDDKSSYASVFMHRFHKITPETKFEGIVHEFIPHKDPVKRFKNTVFEHYGYIFTDPEYTKMKTERNLELLKIQVEESPNNPRIRAQLTDSYLVLGEYDKAIEHAKKGVEICTKKELLNYYYALQLNLIIAYQSQGNYKMVVNEVIKYFKINKNIVLSHIDAFFAITNAYYNLKEFEKCNEAFESYLDLINTHRNKKIETMDSMIRPLMYADESSINRLILIGLSSYIETKSLNKAKKLINYDTLSDFKYINNLSSYFQLELKIMELSKDYSRIKELYNKIENSDKSNVLTVEFEYSIDKYIRSNKEEKDLIINYLINSKIETSYIEFCKIKAVYEYDKVQAKKLILDFNNNIEKLDERYSDIIYYIIDLQMHFSVFANKIDINKLVIMTNLAYDNFKDFTEKISIYESDNDIETNYILTFVYETLLTRSNKNKSEVYSIIYKKYILAFKIYFEFTYNINNLTKHNNNFIYMIPNNMKFGYYCLEAENCLLNNKKVEYIKNLKSALLHDERMDKIISILSENFKAENIIENPISEFEQLALTVKRNIINLIQSGLLKDARLLLNEYKLINPNDPEIMEIEKKI